MSKSMSKPTSGDLSGRTCLITGANTGIGLHTAMALAGRGARVVLACRSEERARPAVEAIRASSGNDAVEVVALDLGNLASVRATAAEVLERFPALHVLINNAGLPGRRGAATDDGFELAFGVNHMGHFLLTTLLLPRIRASAPGRIVTVSSKSHYRAKGIDWEAVRKPGASVTGMPEYEISKLANILFSAELGRQLEGSGITTYALHPGVVATDIWRRVPWPFRSLIKAFMKSSEDGAATTIHCAAAPEAADQTSLYYDECAPRTPSQLSRDTALAAELWRRSQSWCDELAS